MDQVNWSNVSDWSGFLNAPQVATHGWFWTAVIYMIFVVGTISMLGFGLEVALMTMGVIMLLASLLLAYAGLIGWWVVGSFLGLEIFMWLISYATSSRE